ncbi:hypothetical protein [Micromonospora sp. U21]|uniref:hypothetical protein n=1 Tax=Micromonospora sp. U21 TaxID=2824899 RepID=UPI001B359686|nr:hypothetical protein [Micromonospora sp. U21]MBQ0905468.1 hypothetical protein [Micromonospora sp. U21]
MTTFDMAVAGIDDQTPTLPGNGGARFVAARRCAGSTPANPRKVSTKAVDDASATGRMR